MHKTCANGWCKASFDVTDEDLAFYDKVSPVFNGKKELIPAPTLCPECRMQRRMAWRNERMLYRRPCDATKKQIISIYAPEKNVPVYSQAAWWSDGWDQHSSGRPYDATASFFSQMTSLQAVAPRIALLSKNSENSDYTNHSSGNKNCFLSTTVFDCENTFFSCKAFSAKDVADCSYLLDGGELLYECFWAVQCYNSTHLQFCYNVQHSDFCIDCRNCKHCFMSSNLRHKEYYYQNQPVSKEAYEDLMKTWRGSFESQTRLRQEFKDICKQAIHRALNNEHSERVRGDCIFHSHDVYECYHVVNSEALRYCTDCGSRNNSVNDHCMDVFGMNACSFVYEIQGQINGVQNIACNLSYDVSNSCYLDNCHNCKNCFGCIGLKNAEYCILNRQYTRSEYEALVPTIISRMREDGEWGEFFPVSMSPFGYNETIAVEYFALDYDDVLARNWAWRDQGNEVQSTHDEVVVPDNIAETQNDITQHTLLCEVTKKPYKITPQELVLYRKLQIPIPRRCPDQRYNDRIALRNPRKLFDRACAKCQKRIATSYAPDRPEIVYCEECYLKEVY